MCIGVDVHSYIGAGVEACLHLCVQVNMCLSLWRPEVKFSIFLDCFLPQMLKQGLITEPRASLI